jgi:hypothetical protein
MLADETPVADEEPTGELYALKRRMVGQAVKANGFG